MPLVEGGVVGLTGLVMAIRPGESACYRCAFPDAPEQAASCAEAGILGPAAGVIGSLQALEALKLLGGLPALLDAFLQIDLATYEVVRVGVPRRRPGLRLECGVGSLRTVLGTLARELRQDVAAARERDPAARRMGRLAILAIDHGTGLVIGETRPRSAAT